jgi:hypothetical protein
MADDHGMLSNSLLSNEELLVELARARKEAERQGCAGPGEGVHRHPGHAVGACACARMVELEREVELRLATRATPVTPARRAG